MTSRRAGVGIQLFHSPEVSQDGGETSQLQEGQVLVYNCSTYPRIARMEVKPHDFRRQVLVYNCSTHLRLARMEVKPQDFRKGSRLLLQNCSTCCRRSTGLTAD